MDERERAEQTVERLRDQLEPRWDLAREQRVWARLRSQRARPRARALKLALALASVLVVGFAIQAWLDARAREAGPGEDEVEVVEKGDVDEAAQGASGELRLTDGSRLRAEPSARYELARVDAEAIEIEVLEGKLEFDVAHAPSRRFRVRAGGVSVEVIGTAFSVERGPTRVVVEVHRGVVRVEAPGRAPVELERGATLELAFEPTQTPAPSEAAALGESPTLAEGGAKAEVEVEARPRKRASAAKRWRALADAGEHEQAWLALDAGDATDEVDRRDPEALMAAADVARLTRHPEQAVAWLAIVVDDHADSSLAPLAAFTRGRLLLERLGDPSGAAAAFARARALAPKGPLAEDALAREVEALAKAGEASEARERAELFVELHPSGQRRRAVEGWGGLD